MKSVLQLFVSQTVTSQSLKLTLSFLSSRFNTGTIQKVRNGKISNLDPPIPLVTLYSGEKNAIFARRNGMW